MPPCPTILLNDIVIIISSFCIAQLINPLGSLRAIVYPEYSEKIYQGWYGIGKPLASCIGEGKVFEH